MQLAGFSQHFRLYIIYASNWHYFGLKDVNEFNTFNSQGLVQLCEGSWSAQTGHHARLLAAQTVDGVHMHCMNIPIPIIKLNFWIILAYVHGKPFLDDGQNLLLVSSVGRASAMRSEGPRFKSWSRNISFLAIAKLKIKLYTTRCYNFGSTCKIKHLLYGLILKRSFYIEKSI